MPRNYLSLTLIDYLTRFLGTESVTTKIQTRRAMTHELDTLYLSQGHRYNINEHLSYITIIQLHNNNPASRYYEAHFTDERNKTQKD